MQSVSSSRGERMSAIVDGEWSAAEQPNANFADFDQEGHAAWADYHLIGDVLRSDDLALSQAASRAFMSGFAARLEAEPHLLAPAAIAQAPQASARNERVGRILALRRRVVPSLAVAAAAATLTWIVMPQMHSAGLSGTPQIAAVQQSDGMQRVALNTVPAAATGAQDANIIRDAQLDAYLEAHQQFAQQPVMSDSMPYIRSAALSTQAQ